MRFAASPLMVAVALGLLSPMVLDMEDEGRGDHASSSPELEGEPVEAPSSDVDVR